MERNTIKTLAACAAAAMTMLLLPLSTSGATASETSSAGAEAGVEATIIKDMPDRSIDHIYYTRGIHALRHEIDTDQVALDASDHSPVIVEFELR